MEAKRTVCEAFISGKWYLIPVDALRNYKLNKEVLRRCPECKSKIKLMKESHDGNRATMEIEHTSSTIRETLIAPKVSVMGTIRSTVIIDTFTSNIPVATLMKVKSI